MEKGGKEVVALWISNSSWGGRQGDKGGMNLRLLGTGKKIELQLNISHIPVYILASPPGAGMSPFGRSNIRCGATSNGLFR